MGKKRMVTQPQEVRKEMEERICVEISTLDESAYKVRRLALALYHGATCLPQYRREAKKTVISCFKECDSLMTAQALELLFGKEEGGRLLEIMKLRLDGPISDAIFRPPFHSSKEEDYGEHVMIPLIFKWIYGCGCSLDVVEVLTDSNLIPCEEYDLSNRLALELHGDNDEVICAVQQILKYNHENTKKNRDRNDPTISREIIQGIFRSGNRDTIGMLRSMLMDRSQPVEVREMILSSADEGNLEVFTEFLQLVYEEKMYRCPSIARIIDTWLWLGFGSLEPEMARLVLKDSLQFLKHPDLCYKALDQGDLQKVHLALWALAVRNIRQVRPILWEMLHSSNYSKKICAMNFISNVQHESMELPLTMELLEEILPSISQEEPYSESMELLAWVIPNVIPSNLKEQLPKYPNQRQYYFQVLEKTLKGMGREERIFCGKPFVWSMVRTKPELVVESMLRMAEATKDRSMIRSLARNFEYFTPKQRGFYYEYLLDPIHWKEDDSFLQEHQKDRSSTNRLLIREKLEWVQKEMTEHGEEIHRF